MTIHTLPTSEVLCYRAHTPILRHNSHILIADIRTHGIREPLEILTDGTYAKLRDGHQRIEVAKILGLARVPVVIIEHVFSRNERVKWAALAGLRELNSGGIE